jgi:hypothetical protein
MVCLQVQRAVLWCCGLLFALNWEQSLRKKGSGWEARTWKTYCTTQNGGAWWGAAGAARRGLNGESREPSLANRDMLTVCGWVDGRVGGWVGCVLLSGMPGNGAYDCPPVMRIPGRDRPPPPPRRPRLL